MPPVLSLSTQPNANRRAVVSSVLSRPQKAAIIVRLIRAHQKEFSLAALPDDIQVALTEEMTSMRYVDRKRLRQVVDEFSDELEQIGLSFPKDMQDAIGVLDGALSPSATAHLRDLVGLEQISDDPWEQIAELDIGKLLPILQDESIEIGAVLLSKLAVSKSAELLGMIPGEQARRITYAFSQTSVVGPETVHRIGEAIMTRVNSEAPTAFAGGPVERVGAILNYSAAATRDDVMKGLEEEDASFAEEVRKAIFTFVNLPERVEARDVPKITRVVNADTLLLALAAAMKSDTDTVAAEFLLSNMSQRMAAQLRDDIAGLGRIKAKDGEAAMNEVVGAVRELEAGGEIFLIQDEVE